jgi:hypothetical protein
MKEIGWVCRIVGVWAGSGRVVHTRAWRSSVRARNLMGREGVTKSFGAEEKFRKGFLDCGEIENGLDIAV